MPITGTTAAVLTLGGILLFGKKDDEPTGDEEDFEPGPDDEEGEPEDYSEGGDGADDAEADQAARDEAARKKSQAGALLDKAKGKLSDWWDDVDQGDDEPVEDMPTYGPDPNDPTPTPMQGAYYHVEDGDTMIKICRKAGLPDAAWRTMRDHERNAWIPKMKMPEYGGQKGFPMRRWYDPPGYQTTCHKWHAPPLTAYTFEVVYVPTLAEHEAK